MAMSGVAYRKALVDIGRAISVLFGINGLRNKVFCRAYISSIYGPFFSYDKLEFLESLD